MVFRSVFSLRPDAFSLRLSSVCFAGAASAAGLALEEAFAAAVDPQAPDSACAEQARSAPAVQPDGYQDDCQDGHRALFDSAELPDDSVEEPAASRGDSAETD